MPKHRTHRRSAATATPAALMAAVVLAAGCGAFAVAGGRDARDATVRGVAPSRSGATVTSNVHREDYAGSRACVGCHADVAATWARSPMHRMTRSTEDHATEVHAPFDGAVFRFKGDSAELFKRGPSRFVRIRSAKDGTRVYRVTRVIGGRIREDFAGVLVPDSEAGPDGADGRSARASAHASEAESEEDDRSTPASLHDELVLPVSYLIAERAFRLKGYSVMVKERPGLRAGPIWNQTCVFCHNTTPFFTTVYGAFAGERAPGYQGTFVDRTLPPRLRARYVVADAAAARNALEREIGALGASLGEAIAETSARGRGDDALQAAFAAASQSTRRHLRANHFVEIGIGCEACHGGAREHAADPRKRPSWLPTSNAIAVEYPRPEAPIPLAASPGEARTRSPDATGPLVPPADAERAVAINRVCARCHQVLFSRYPHTWEGGRRGPSGGGSHITSGEARDFLLGGCSGSMACTSCHDPHGGDRARQLALETPRGNAVCTACHSALATPDALRAHAHHDPNGRGGTCIACHMPKKNMGLGYELTRYHRIGSPTDRARVENDRPLECALCHTDKSVAEIVTAMERSFGKRFDKGALRALYGDLDANALEATLARGKPHEVVPAMIALADARHASAAFAIAPHLGHEFPLVRYFARDALGKLFGTSCAVDVDNGAADAIRREGHAWVTSRMHSSSASGRASEP